MILSVELKNQRAEVLSSNIDSTNAVLNLLTSGDDILVALNFEQPSAIDISNGTLTFASLAEQMVLLTGEAFKAEIVSDDGAVLAQVSVSDENGSGDIKLPRLQFFAGDLFRISNWTVNEL